MSEIDTPLLITYNITENGIKSIGINWSDYYITKWSLDGYNLCSVEIINTTDKILGDLNYAKIKLTIYSIPEKNLARITPGQLLTLSEESDKDITKQQDYFIWINSNLADSQLKRLSILGSNNKYIDIRLINFLLANSVNYLDNTIDIIYNYESNQQFVYPLNDFLYFSAVTITTVGYGDILPNSSTIRTIVMIESILGLILIALFVSDYYHWISLRKDKKT